ncbi:hypothetical protein [Reinekea marinisedimentorum]|uniref:Uncharacterized protein n=1 Tax=Reinekea marinisedimentorum TaxID=230495 RepID=A0A4R3I5V6_9GAMM|nr:hypothetical protein [Reinekea marinisedimentorum]TCS41397.1 hypothetical protein BCF53_106128 [Reinekea marinisedimentorum]
MQVLVFDLDTALCPTSTMDGMAMASAIKDVADCQIAPESVMSLQDWKSIWYRAVKRVATKRELIELRQRFSFHLKRQFLIRPSVVLGNYPLIHQVNKLQGHKNMVVCLVSATCPAAVDIKARSVGLMCQQIPVVTGQDAESPEALLTLAQARVMRSYGLDLKGGHLIAGEGWQKASALLQMHHCLPDDFLKEDSYSVKQIQPEDRFTGNYH